MAGIVYYKNLTMRRALQKSNVGMKNVQICVNAKVSLVGRLGNVKF